MAFVVDFSKLRQGVFRNTKTDEEWAIGALHIVDGRAGHKVPGRTPERRLAFKTDCIERALLSLYKKALARPKAQCSKRGPRFILGGDFNLPIKKVGEFVGMMVQRWRGHHKIIDFDPAMVGVERDFIISSSELKDVADAAKNVTFPRAWDSMHRAIVAEQDAPSEIVALPCYVGSCAHCFHFQCVCHDLATCLSVPCSCH